MKVRRLRVLGGALVTCVALGACVHTREPIGRTGVSRVARLVVVADEAPPPLLRLPVAMLEIDGRPQPSAMTFDIPAGRHRIGFSCPGSIVVDHMSAQTHSFVAGSVNEIVCTSPIPFLRAAPRAPTETDRVIAAYWRLSSERLAAIEQMRHQPRMEHVTRTVDDPQQPASADLNARSELCNQRSSLRPVGEGRSTAYTRCLNTWLASDVAVRRRAAAARPIAPIR